MIDNLIFTRNWQDIDFFQIAIEYKTEFLIVHGEVYTADDLIDDLYNKIDRFLSGNVDSSCWQNGTRGDASTPCITLRFFHKDSSAMF